MEIFNQSFCASVDHPNDQQLIPIFIDTSEGQGETLLHQNARQGFFRAMINNSHTAMEADQILRYYLQQNRQSRWSVQKLSASAFQVLQRFEHLDISHTSHSKFDVTTSIRILNKAHRTHKKTPGKATYYTPSSLKDGLDVSLNLCGLTTWPHHRLLCIP